MTSVIGPVTLERKRELFDKALKDAVELGISPNMSLPFWPDIIDDIYEVSKSWPKTNAAGVAKARRSFAAYAKWWATP